MTRGVAHLVVTDELESNVDARLLAKLDDFGARPPRPDDEGLVSAGRDEIGAVERDGADAVEMTRQRLKWLPGDR